MQHTLREALDAVRELRALGAMEISIGELKVSFDPLDATSTAALAPRTEPLDEPESNGAALEPRDLILARIAAMQA